MTRNRLIVTDRPRPARASNIPPLRVVLASTGNPDYQQTAGKTLPGVAQDVVAVSSLRQASEVCRAYIGKHQLGGGNWAGGDVLDASGVIVARVSYNGKVWPAEAWHVGQQPLYVP